MTALSELNNQGHSHTHASKEKECEISKYLPYEVEEDFQVPLEKSLYGLKFHERGLASKLHSTVTIQEKEVG